MKEKTESERQAEIAAHDSLLIEKLRDLCAEVSEETDEHDEHGMIVLLRAEGYGRIRELLLSHVLFQTQEALERRETELRGHFGCAECGRWVKPADASQKLVCEKCEPFPPCEKCGNPKSRQYTAAGQARGWECPHCNPPGEPVRGNINVS